MTVDVNQVTELFRRYDAGEVDLEECAKGMKAPLLELMESDVAGEKQKFFGELHISLHRSLTDYKSALNAKKLNDPDADIKFSRADTDLRKSVMAAYTEIRSFLIKGTDTFQPSHSTKQTENQPITTHHAVDGNLEQKYLEMIQMNPDDDYAYNNLGNYYFSIGKYDQAIGQYKLAISKRPDEFRYYSNIGDAYKRLKDYDKAINWYDQALTKSPNDHVSLNSLAEIYYLQEKYQEAIEYLRKAIRISPDPAYLVNMGDIYLKKQEPNQAIDFYDNALSISPEFRGAHGAIADAYIQKYIQEGDQAVINKAIEHLTKAIDLDPTIGIHYVSLGGTYNHLARWDEAIQSFSKAIEIDPNDSYSHTEIGFAYFKKGDYDKALEYYNKAIGIDPKNARAFSYLGEYYAKKQDWENAIKNYKEALKIEPQDDTTVNLLGTLYYDRGNYDLAAKYYEDAKNIDPRNFLYYSNLGTSYSKLERWDDAVNSYKEAIKLNDRDAITFIGLGDAYVGTGLFKHAIDQYKKAASLDVDSYDSYAHIAETYCRLRMWTEAARYARLADQKARMSFGNDYSQHNLALVFHEKGLYLYDTQDYNAAIQELKTSLTLKEFDATYYGLFLCYYALNQYKEAKRSLLKAIDLKKEPRYLESLEDPKLSEVRID